MCEKVVITGIGMVTPMAFGTEETWEALCNGVSGIKPITRFNPINTETKIGGQIDDEKLDCLCKQYISRKVFLRTTLFSKIGLLAAYFAKIDAGMDEYQPDPERIGVVMGNADGSQAYKDQLIGEWFKNSKNSDLVKYKFKKSDLTRVMQSSVASQICIENHFLGPSQVTSVACASGLAAIANAYDQIKCGYADVMFTGGADVFISEHHVSLFNELGVLSVENERGTEAVRPFDESRSGMLLGDGGAVLVIENLEHAKKRNARIYSEISGYSATSEAYNIVSPIPEGVGMNKAMKQALDRAKVNSEDINYVSAHGTGTYANDDAEWKAIQRQFSGAKNLSVNAIKSITGHSIGGSSSIQTAAAALSIYNDVIPPTLNFNKADQGCNLNIVSGSSQEKKIPNCLVNAFGFGGHNISMVFNKFKD